MNKKPKITFMPGAFDSFEGSQEELDQLIKSIEEGIENGDLFEKSQPVDLDKMEEEDPELAATLRELFEKLDQEDNQDRKRKLN